MNDRPTDRADKTWLDAEMLDSFDEELELELDDERVARELRDIAALKSKSSLDRRDYFRELFRLQSELIKLQDWVAHTGSKVAVIFEGRDAAGKGGVIKRITQRLNPRSCRVVALPAPTEREKVELVFPALRSPSSRGRRNRSVRPLLVQPCRCRKGHGVCNSGTG